MIILQSKLAQNNTGSSQVWYCASSPYHLLPNNISLIFYTKLYVMGWMINSQPGWQKGLTDKNKGF